MASGAIGMAGGNATADAVFALASREGSAVHAFPGSPMLLGGPGASRNLADLVHFFCSLHGRAPGAIDLAVEKQGEQVGDWLRQAARGFTAERGWLTRLVVAAGPLPSTPGQAECEAAVIAAQHAIEMLARSDRAGCATGAAIGLVLDWRAVRPVLDLAAERFGVDPLPNALPGDLATRAFIEEAAATPALERAISFGVDQVMAQHRGLWDILESREQARRGH